MTCQKSGLISKRKTPPTSGGRLRKHGRAQLQRGCASHLEAALKTLGKPNDALEIRGRILALRADDTALWGVMDVTQMVCHLREPYLFALSPDPVQQVPLPIPATAAKYMALHSPLAWPKHLPTLPEFKIGGARMATTTFAGDCASLIEAFDRFCAVPNLTKDHPFFTTMSHADWMRWGYLHADHHLRQFGR